MSLPVHGYLRTHRRKWALTQKELAFLLGHKSSTHVSRLEKIDGGSHSCSSNLIRQVDRIGAFSVVPDASQR